MSIEFLYIFPLLFMVFISSADSIFLTLHNCLLSTKSLLEPCLSSFTVYFLYYIIEMFVDFVSVKIFVTEKYLFWMLKINSVILVFKLVWLDYGFHMSLLLSLLRFGLILPLTIQWLLPTFTLLITFMFFTILCILRIMEQFCFDMMTSMSTSTLVIFVKCIYEI